MTEQEYNTVHKWVAYNFKKTGRCSQCKSSGLSGHKIHWANLSGKYQRSREDWIELCAKCHQKFDKRYKVAQPVFIECLQCNEFFYSYRCFIGKKFYCSTQCYAKSRAGQPKNIRMEQV